MEPRRPEVGTGNEVKREGRRSGGQVETRKGKDQESGRDWRWGKD